MSRKNVGARLPGVRFEVQEPPLAEVLPRMDVTVFVGFAASGPVGVPVAVADAAQFAAVFGDDTPLAADPERGEPARAYLASAVRSFFVNGGRRCWVVRVARDARSNRFPLPAMLARRGGGALAPAFAVARSEGSWSDALRVGASLKTRAVEVTKATPNDLSFELAPSSPGDVRVGDLLRFSFRDEGFALLAVVTEAATTGGGAQSPPGSSPNRRAVVSVRCGDALWCRTRWLSGSGFDPLPATASVIGGAGPPPPPAAVAEWSFSELEQSVTALLSVPLSGAPREGDRIRLDFGDAELQFTART
ncbi:MAG TPA: hypothetical protein VD968_12115, partial [Pyrinomonadaceae bacterium]|nr:hypothetical protein [Pyrinomonadaceae bacterium]